MGTAFTMQPGMLGAGMISTEHRPWAHAPCHRFTLGSTYIVTGSTYLKQHLMRAPQRLNGFQNLLFGLVEELSWQLDAWVIFSNHYHFIGRAPDSKDAKQSV